LPKAGGTITGNLVTQGILTLDGVTSNSASDLLKLKFDNSPADTGIIFTDLNSTVKNRISMDSANTNDLTISATTNMRFHTNSSSTANERMRIDANGNVGIKTTEPNHQLTVNGVIKTMSNNSIANSYSIVKYLTGSGTAITAITMTIPATPCFIGIEMFAINTRIIDGNAATSRIGKKYFTIARYGSGHDVVLEQGYSDDEFTHVTASVGGAYYTGNGDTSIVREGSEANTASQNVKITFQPGRPGHTGGKACLKFDILALITGNDGAFVVDA